MNANLPVTGHHDLEHAGGGHKITGRITVTGVKTNASPELWVQCMLARVRHAHKERGEGGHNTV